MKDLWREAEKDSCTDRMEGWKEGKPHLASKRQFGLSIQQKESPEPLISCSQRQARTQQ